MNEKITVTFTLDDNISKHLNKLIKAAKTLNNSLKEKYREVFDAGFKYAESLEMNTDALDFESWYKEKIKHSKHDPPKNPKQ